MKRILFLFLALSLSFSTLAFAHGGRTDEYVCYIYQLFHSYSRIRK